MDSENNTKNDTRFILDDRAGCDAPRCGQIGSLRCERCRTCFYCSSACQEKHWYSEHYKSCVDFEQKCLEKLQPRALYSVPSAINTHCLICLVHIPERGGTRLFVLSGCRHGFCWECLIFHEECYHHIIKGCYRCPACLDEDPKGSYSGVIQEILTTMDLAIQSLKRKEISVSERYRIFDYARILMANVTQTDRADHEKIQASLMKFLPSLKVKDYDLSLVAKAQLGRELPSMSQTHLGNLRRLCVKVARYPSDTSLSNLLELVGAVISAKVDMAMEEWRKARDILELLVEEKVSVFVQIPDSQMHAWISLCQLKLGDVELSIDSAKKAVASDRHVAGVHRYLADAYEATGDLDAARKAMRNALLYEEPWNEVTRSENLQHLASLSPEAVELRKKEARFLLIWERVLYVLASTGSKEESWESIKTLKYDIRGIDEDDGQESELKRVTAEKLENAARTASTAVTGPVEEADNIDLMQGTEYAEQEALAFQGSEVENALQHETDYTPSTFKNIKLTKDALKWINQADPKYRGFFIRRIEQLAAGTRSRILAKRLRGCKKTIYETYLEQKVAMRILWTEQKNEVLIWYVAKHDDVSRLIGMIDKAENRRLTSARALSEFERNDALDDGRDRILLDPKCDTPLKLYFVHLEDIQKFSYETWRPPLYLTDQEREIVETSDGTVLLLGRSGTGKTVCIATRIDYDRHLAAKDATFSQLFVARSPRICKYVRETVGDGDPSNEEDGKRLDFFTFKHLVELCEGGLGGCCPEYKSSGKRVDFKRFKRDFAPLIQNSGLDPLVVWTQIQSSIKGSIQAVVAGRPLNLDEYLDKNIIGARRCRLTDEQRTVAYQAFKVYDERCRESALWDDCDRVSSLLHRMKNSDTIPDSLAYRRIYVDEVQDYCQAEIALFYKHCQGGYMFFAGDPAQSVVEGIEFRFEEIRSVAYHLLPKDLHPKFMPKKPSKVTVNFRSHSGILNVAAAVLDRLFVGFKDSAPDLLSKDLGLFNGPRPGLFENLGHEGLLQLVAKIDGVVVLAMNDETVKELSDMLPSGVVVLSIRDSKGLEFPDVILVDFFRGLMEQHQKAWRTLLQDVNDLAGFQEEYPEIETHLKQLYTAITRCSIRFFFAETAPSIAGQSFVKWVTRKDLAVKQSLTALKGVVKTADEWRSTGIEYAMNAEASDDPDRSIFWLEKAIECFERGEAQDLATKAKLHIESFKFLQELDNGEDTRDQDDTEQLLKRSAKLLEDLIEAGLKLEAAKLCLSLKRFLDEYSWSRFEESVLPLLPALD